MCRLWFLLLFGFLTVSDNKPTDNSKDNYTVGDYNISITEAPYQVAVLINNSLFCGGFVITEKYIGTAAHCVIEDINDILIRAGSNEAENGGTVLNVKKGIMYPGYDISNNENDVGIYELKTPLNFSNSIKPIKMVDQEPVPGESVRVSGWGKTQSNGVKSQYLLSVIVSVVDREKCKKQYNNTTSVITDTMICASEKNKDSCQGDSGGALVYKGEAAGIVSFGEGCADINYPGVYTNIAHPNIRKFIKDHTGV